MKSVWWNNGWMLLLCCAIQSCSSFRHLPSTQFSGEGRTANTAERNTFFQHLQQHPFEFTTLNARAKGLMTLNDQNHEVNVHLRIRRDEAIWMSVTTFIGMEVGRLLLTPDSIRVINRLDGVFQVRPYTMIGDVLGVHLSFGELQQALVGNVPHFSQTPLPALRLFDEGSILQVPAEGAEWHVDNAYRLRMLSRPPVNVQHEYQLKEEHAAFPVKTSVRFEGNRISLTATLEYQRLSLDQPLELPFTIPKGYTKIP